MKGKQILKFTGAGDPLHTKEHNKNNFSSGTVEATRQESILFKMPLRKKNLTIR